MIELCKPFLLFLILVTNLICFGQTKEIDSLRRTLEINKNDSDKLKTLHNLCIKLRLKSEFNEALECASQGINISSNLKNEKDKKNWTIKFLRESKINYFAKNDFPNSLKCMLSVLKINEELDDKEGICSAYFDLAISYKEEGSYAEALEILLKAQKIQQGLNNSYGIALSYSELGENYSKIGDFKLSLKNYLLAIRKYEEYNDTVSASYILYSVGDLFVKRHEADSALKYFLEAIKIVEKKPENSRDNQLIANAFSRIGESYEAKEQYNVAIRYVLQSIKINEKFGGGGLADSYFILSRIYYKQQELISAQKFCSKALLYIDRINWSPYERWTLSEKANVLMSNIEMKLGRCEESIAYHKASISARDSLHNENRVKKSVREQMQFEIDKKLLADSLKLVEERNINDIKFKQERDQRYFLYGGLALLILFGSVMFNRFTVTKKQKFLIEKKEKETQVQKHLIEEKQKEIVDSISYAKRLQEAILPPQQFVNTHLINNFIYYQPKDIVAGDFYWAEKVDDFFFIAAADSTGHGVPGAMVSVVCSNALNRTIKEFKLTETGKILDKTRELVIETFEKSASEVKDGMDISLLCIDSKNKNIFWSGANNPLWYIQDSELKEIKGDKQPVGKSYDTKPFTTNEISYKSDTTFYLFTDGLADQFGGPKGKKFKYKQFEELLVSINDKPMQEQSDIISQKFEEWRGILEQVDDVCVIGIKI